MRASKKNNNNNTFSVRLIIPPPTPAHAQSNSASKPDCRYTPLMNAAFNARASLTKLLVEHPRIDTRHRCKVGRTPSFAAGECHSQPLLHSQQKDWTALDYARQVLKIATSNKDISTAKVRPEPAAAD